MKIVIDENAGFCSGVSSAVRKAEKELERSGRLYCLGNIVHNTVERNRLQKKGLEIIDYDTFRSLKNTRVLIRAHGEPPEIYKIARDNNLVLIDATCPIVTRLQLKVKEALEESEKKGGCIVIFGKKEHPEVVALRGITGGKAKVARTPDEIKNTSIGTPVFLFAQTTMNREVYKQIEEEIRQYITSSEDDTEPVMHTHHTVCGEVSCRLPRIREFAEHFDIILFVSGKESSNGKMLFEACKQANSSSHFVSAISDLKNIDFTGAASIGISGATSTPPWLLDKVKEAVIERVGKI